MCVVTTNRSDWSKLRPVASSLRDQKNINLEIIVLGSHMLDELGGTKANVKAEFPKAYEIHSLVAGDTTVSMTDSVGFGIVKITSLLTAIRPDIVLIHGDRFDAFSAAISANMLNLTVAHIEGGELSGTVDGTLRHAITKLSHLHFVCTVEASRRIRGMGENPKAVFHTGCPSYDELFGLSQNCWQDNKMDEFFSGTPFTVQPKSFLLVLMHPVTTDIREGEKVFGTLLAALFELKIPTVLFYPNVDPGNKTFIRKLHLYQKEDLLWTKWLRLVTHVPPSMFMTLMKDAIALLGNSSAGIRETCVYGTPTLNVGSRQQGRKASSNVTTMLSPTKVDIIKWIENFRGKTFSPSFEYGHPDSAKRIATILASVDFEKHNAKGFWEPTYALLPRRANRQLASLPRSLASKIFRAENPCSITARGGSKGIPGKNIIDLDGKPRFSIQ